MLHHQRPHQPTSFRGTCDSRWLKAGFWWPSEGQCNATNRFLGFQWLWTWPNQPRNVGGKFHRVGVPQRGQHSHEWLLFITRTSHSRIIFDKIQFHTDLKNKSQFMKHLFQPHSDCIIAVNHGWCHGWPRYSMVGECHHHDKSGTITICSYHPTMLALSRLVL